MGGEELDDVYKQRSGKGNKKLITEHSHLGSCVQRKEVSPECITIVTVDPSENTEHVCTH